MRRREFIAGLGAAALPVVAEAQPGEPMRRIGLLMGWTDADPEARSWLAAFVQGFRELGWPDGIDLHIDERWIDADATRAPALMRKLIELQPDVIVTGSTPATAAAHRETKTIPIVFAVVNDPVGEGFRRTLSRPARPQVHVAFW
jgi:putative tryptophan/tyrosine transport system substrate-binding protein